jgi:hypothetical protein
MGYAQTRRKGNILRTELKKISAFIFLLNAASTVWSFDFDNCSFVDVQHFEWAGQKGWVELYEMLDRDYDIGPPSEPLLVLSKTKINSLFSGRILDLYRIDFEDTNNHMYRIFIWYDASGTEYSVGFELT